MVRQLSKNLTAHSDRGIQYAGEAFRQALKENGAVSPMRRKRKCLDNAVAESFWSRLKAESVEPNALDARAQARAVVRNTQKYKYIDEFYNPMRRYSHLDWLSPMEFERQAR